MFYNNKKNKNNFNKIEKKQLDKINNLKFGTAGLRGVIGNNENNINIYNIKKATIAFLKYLQSIFPDRQIKKRGILIGRDNRYFSKKFSKEVINILILNNIKIYLFKNNPPIPTPIISYSISKINAIAGIVITASHNSKKYNGYKIYDQYGCQFLPYATTLIDKEFLNLNIKKEKIIFNLENNNKNLINFISNDLKINYINDIKSIQFYPNIKKNIKIIFSNLHGTSKNWTPLILKKFGYNVEIVKEQYNMFPSFPYAPNPNPELKECFDIPIKYAKKFDSDLIILNDPDSDRVGIAIKDSFNKYKLISTNDLAPILIEYLFFHYKKLNILPKNGVIYNTFVTSDLSDKVAKNYGIKVIKTLTGFKWIGSRIFLDKNKNLKFLFAFEEACGYLVKDILKDKDGIQTSLLISEACWWFINNNKKFDDVLNNLYSKFGYYYCKNIFFILNENSILIDYNKFIKNIFDIFLNEKQILLNNIKCIKIENFIKGLYGMPPENLLKFYFEDGSWFAIRPSGTESKIKIYFVCIDYLNLKNAKNKMNLMFKDLQKKYFSLFNLKFYFL